MNHPNGLGWVFGALGFPSATRVELQTASLKEFDECVPIDLFGCVSCILIHPCAISLLSAFEIVFGSVSDYQNDRFTWSRDSLAAPGCYRRSRDKVFRKSTVCLAFWVRQFSVTVRHPIGSYSVCWFSRVPINLIVSKFDIKLRDPTERIAMSCDR